MHNALPSIPFIQPGDEVVLRTYTVSHTLGGQVVETIVSLRHTMAEARRQHRDSADALQTAERLARKRNALDPGKARITCIRERLAVAR